MASFGLRRSLFDRRVHLRFHLPRELRLVPLRHAEHVADGAAFDGFLDVPAALFVFIEEDVRLVHPAEKIVQIAHDVLVGAHEEEAEVVRLAGLQLVQRQRVFHVLQVDELADLAVGIAGDIDERAIALGIVHRADESA